MTDYRPPSIVPPPNNVPYIVAVVVMTIFGVAGSVAISIFRQQADNLLVIGALFGFLTPATLALLAFMKAQETHLSVNSRLDAFMSNATMAAHAKGLLEGRGEGRDSANDRTDALALQNRAPSE